MSDLIEHVLASYALWYGLAHGTLPIWGNLRDKMAEKWVGFGLFMLCPMCFGFWCSFCISLGQMAWKQEWSSWTDALVHGLAGAAGCFLIETFVLRREAERE